MEKPPNQVYVTEELRDFANNDLTGAKSARYSYVWPPDDSESGFIITLEDETTLKVLVTQNPGTTTTQ